MKFFHAFLMGLFHLGYFGPLVMGVLDSSFLVLPFGNDLLLVYLVAQKHHGAPLFVLMAAAGSTIGATVLALISRKVGKAGICKLAGEKQFNKLQKRLSHRASIAIALGALAPPPFPYTIVIAVASALDRSLVEILATNFFARAVRFAILAFLAVKYGKEILRIMGSAPFRWSMVVFILLCLVVSGISIWRWWRKTRAGKDGEDGKRDKKGESKQPGQPAASAS